MKTSPLRGPILVAAVVATLASGQIRGGAALAGPIDLQALPADTNCLVHFDVEALVTSAAFTQLRFRDDLRAQLKGLGLAIDPEKDVLDVTAVAFAGDEEFEAARIRLAATARKPLEDYLSTLPEHVTLAYGTHVVHACGRPHIVLNLVSGTISAGDIKAAKDSVAEGDDGAAGRPRAATVYFAFADDRTLLYSWDVRLLTKLLDIAAGKADSLATKGDESWKARCNAPPGTWMTSVGVGKFLKGKMPPKDSAASPAARAQAFELAKGIDAGWVYLGESKPDFFFECHIETAETATAQQIKAIADGLKAMMLFAEGGDKNVAELVKHLEAKVEGTSATLAWRYPTARVVEIMKDSLRVNVLKASVSLPPGK